MMLEDWHAYLESAPLTGNQLGRIHAECRRLGISDRAERLAITGALAGDGELASTRELTQGQAGRVVRALMECQDRADLPAVNRSSASPADNEPQPVRPVIRASLAWQNVIVTVAKMLVPGAWQTPDA